MSESATPPNGRVLSSWKEIASFLDVSLRTAQLWEEERGLPVHRLPGRRSRVWTTVAELKAWQVAAPPVAAPLEQPQLPKQKPSRAFAAGMALLVIVTAASVFAWAHWSTSRVPVSWRVEHQSLIVLDERGEVLWRKRFDSLSNLYEGRLQRVWIGDLDGDSKPEVLFALVPAKPEESTHALICYDATGKELWRYTAGGPARTRRESFQVRYPIHNLAVGPVGPNGQRGIVITSLQYPWYPTQVTWLDAQGQRLGEYWHSGHLPWLLLADLDRNGTAEIYLGGINQEHKAATVVVLDANRMTGASQETNPDYQLLDREPAHERARLFFPRSCLNRSQDPYNVTHDIAVDGDRLVAHIWEHPVSVDGPSIMYTFDPRLLLQKVEFSDLFLAEHRTSYTRHLLDHPFTPAEEKTFWNVSREP